MSAPLLTVDVGNSRCKLRFWGADGGVLGDAAFATGAAREDAVTEWLDARARPEFGAIASVASDGQRALWEGVLAARCAQWIGTPDHGLTNRCRTPETVGADRLFAARGAFELAGCSCLVLDAGTALTVDALRVVGGAPQFLGGAIAPGPELLARALALGGARLPAIAPGPDVPALGVDTPSALAAGVAVGFQGAAAELVRRVAAEAGLGPRDPLFLTGGARDYLTSAGLFERAPRVHDDLVHLGLRAAASAVRPVSEDGP